MEHRPASDARRPRRDLWSYGLVHELEEAQWQNTIDVVLTGVWHTCKAAVPKLIEQGDGGSIIFTSSVVGLKGVPDLADSTA
jgi:NAD(P)-dependent dehydrogenase (short-subunit alcohol dehydrogenase family)